MDPTTVASIMQAVQDLVPTHASIAITDARRYLYYQPSKVIDLKIQPGDEIKEGTATHKALVTQSKISEYIDSRVLGVPYFGISVPILDGERIKGCMTTILPAKPSKLLTRFLTVLMSDRWIPVPYDQVLYLEAQNRKTRVQTTRGLGFHKRNLSELEFLLPDDSFIRVHRSYIVNVNSISEIHPDSHSTFLLIMKDKAKIPVSQTYASAFRKSLQF
jgi:two-component system, LytTR family, response regulator LytT